MRTIRARSIAAVAAGALLLAPLAACGSDDDKDKDAKPASASSSPAEPSASPSATDDADEAVAAPGERLTKDSLVATMVAAMRAKKTAHIELEVGSSMAASADTRYAGSSTDMRMTMSMGPTEALVIMVDGTMYIQQSKGAKFVEIGPDDPSLGSLIGQVTSMGPAASVAAMRGAIKKVEFKGEDEVDGDDVDHYRVTVDTTEIAKGAVGAPGSADLPKTLTYDMYVDEDHLMRQVDLAVSGQEIHMVVSRWGEPVDIEAPPASKIQRR